MKETIGAGPYSASCTDINRSTVLTTVDIGFSGNVRVVKGTGNYQRKTLTAIGNESCHRKKM